MRGKTVSVIKEAAACHCGGSLAVKHRLRMDGAEDEAVRGLLWHFAELKNKLKSGYYERSI
jgi:hypothetical protein